MPSSPDRGLSRRAFTKAAVAIGGASALSACLDRGNVDVPQGPSDLTELPTGQQAWDEYLDTDEHGNTLGPRHRVLLYLDYPSDGPPSDADRTTLERALDGLDRAYERGSNGLAYTISYSPMYFDRFEVPLPDSVDLPEPKALSPFEEPDFDRPDAVLHLASDHGAVVLVAEEALFGEKDSLNGVEMDASLTEVFERGDRRTGFVGDGLPAEHQDVDGIPDGEPVPDDAPLYMGFESGFTKNQATEERVTINEGPFAGGTTQHVSKIQLRLKDWYGEQDHEDRVAEMFCPFHAGEGLVEGTGESLGDSNQVEDCHDGLKATAREFGRVGHAQKVSEVREGGSPVILRRDFDSTDGNEAGVHFVSLQREITDFEATREAMNATKIAESPAIRQRANNGILDYTFVERRGNFLVPPRELRAFPTPQPRK